MQELFVLGVVPGTNIVIPIYFWIIFGFIWILLFWNIDKIHFGHRRHRENQTQSVRHIQQASVAVSHGMIASLSSLLRTIVYGVTMLAEELIALLAVCARFAVKAITAYVVWADAKANSVHMEDLKKIKVAPSNE